MSSEVFEPFLQFLLELEPGKKVHIEPFETGWRIRVGDGRQLVEHSDLSHHEGIALAEFLLKEAGILEKAMNLPMVGHLKLNADERERWLQVSSTPVIWGVTLVVTVARTELPFLEIEDLGFTAGVVGALRAALAERSGLIVIGGKSRSGRSTTLRAMLALAAAAGRKVAAIEYADQGALPGVEHHLVDPPGGRSVASLMQTIAAHEATVIKTYLDIPTEMTAALDAATDKLVLADLHIPAAFDLLARFLVNGVSPTDVASRVRLVAAQRLVPKLCAGCKARKAASPTMLKSLGIDAAFLQELGLSDVKPDGIGFFSTVGCDRCHGRGTLGAMPIAEILPMTPGMRELVQTGGFERAAFEREAACAGLVSLRKQTLALAVRGVIRVEDALMG